MLLERNGKSLSGKLTKHINVQYFFIIDCISKGKVRVKWCPTKDMVADFLTKPLQGAMFKRFQVLIMGVLPKRELYKVLTCDNVSDHEN